MSQLFNNSGVHLQCANINIFFLIIFESHIVLVKHIYFSSITHIQTNFFFLNINTFSLFSFIQSTWENICLVDSVHLFLCTLSIYIYYILLLYIVAWPLGQHMQKNYSVQFSIQIFRQITREKRNTHRIKHIYTLHTIYSY